MTALVQLAQQRVVPYARTRFNIIHNESQYVATPRSRFHTWLWGSKGHSQQVDVGGHPCIGSIG
eukprot:1717756-Prorocentrum_lima.AAC.1